MCLFFTIPASKIHLSKHAYFKVLDIDCQNAFLPERFFFFTSFLLAKLEKASSLNYFPILRKTNTYRFMIALTVVLFFFFVCLCVRRVLCAPVEPCDPLVSSAGLQSTPPHPALAHSLGTELRFSC